MTEVTQNLTPGRSWSRRVWGGGRRAREKKEVRAENASSREHTQHILTQQQVAEVESESWPVILINALR